MNTDEMKIIEILLNFIDNRGDAKRLIEENFSSIEDFQSSKINLFNLISINSVISLNPNLSDKEISNVISQIQLIINNKYSDRELLNIIIKALKENKYKFDVNNNILIKYDDLELVVSSSWLYNLSILFNNNTFNRILLFNKNEDKDITNEDELLRYLYHTKAFLISLKGDNKDLERIYKHAIINSKGMLLDKDSIKSYDIKDVLYRNIPTDVETHITNYDFKNYNMFTDKVVLEKDFYKKSLRRQKEIISRWILEDETIDVNDNIELSKLLFACNNKSFETIEKEIDINKCISGLFRIYIWMLLNSGIDYTDLFLSKIKIKTYLDEEIQDEYLKLKSVVREYNDSKYDKEREKLAKQVNNNIVLVNNLRSDNKDDDLDRVYSNIRYLVDEYINNAKEQDSLGEKRNSIQNIIYYKRNNSTLDVAFDNDKIMDLLKIAINEGRIYVDNNRVIHIEINNKDMGMKVFEAVIPFDSFIYFVECANESVRIDNYRRKKYGN